MNTDELRKRFPDEKACRDFFESVRWSNGRRCPHCQCSRSYPLNGKTSRPGLYECARCKKQFTVTTGTPMHSTKLPLWKWIQSIYFMVSSSKGVSSVVLGRMVGISQKSAWKVGHAVRLMMAAPSGTAPMLSGIVELDEKYLGGKPRYREGVSHRRGRGTQKQ
jgi:transposase-like protein